MNLRNVPPDQVDEYISELESLENQIGFLLSEMKNGAMQYQYFTKVERIPENRSAGLSWSFRDLVTIETVSTVGVIGETVFAYVPLRSGHVRVFFLATGHPV